MFGPAHLCQLFLVHLCVTGAGVFGLLLGKNSLGLIVLRLALRRRLVDPGIQVQTAQTNSLELHWCALMDTLHLSVELLVDHIDMNEILRVSLKKMTDTFT